MPDVIAPRNTVTFTITKVPGREAQRKTIQRLMRMQTEIQRGLNKLSRKRALTDNVRYIRAGRPWVNRKRTTKLAIVKEGNQFTLHVTPQIMNDIKSVEQFLDAKAA